MIKFVTIEEDGSIAPRMNPCLMSFGITEALIPAIAALATSAGVGAATAGTIASIAAPALVSAGVGAGTSALFGQDPGMGALLGGVGGALGPALGAAGIGNGGGILSQVFGGGAGAGQNWAGSVMDDGSVIGGNAGAAPGMSMMDNGDMVSNAGQTAASAVTGGGRGVAAAQNKPGGALGGLGLGQTLGLLGALSAQANRPASTQAPPPPGSTTPWNPNPGGTLARTPIPQTMSLAPSGSYYTYGAGPEQNFFANNRLQFGTPGMAHGGALSRAIHGGKYGQGGPHFSTGGGENYVDGQSGGQDDDVDAKLSNGEYVVDATSVSRLGDGNNEAGAKKLDEMRHLIANDSGSNRVVQKKTRGALHYLKDVA